MPTFLRFHLCVRPQATRDLYDRSFLPETFLALNKVISTNWQSVPEICPRHRLRVTSGSFDMAQQCRPPCDFTSAYAHRTRELDDGSPIVDVEIRPCPKAGRKNLSSTPRPRLIAIFGSPNTSDLWLFNFGDETFGHPPRNDTSLWTLLAKVVRKCMFSSGHPPRCAVPPNGLDCADLTDFNRATIVSASTH